MRTGSCSSQATSSTTLATLRQNKEKCRDHAGRNKSGSNCKQASELNVQNRHVIVSVIVCLCLCVRRIPWRPAPSAASPSWSASCGRRARPTTLTASPAWCATAAWTASLSPSTRPTRSTASRTFTSSFFQLLITV